MLRILILCALRSEHAMKQQCTHLDQIKVTHTEKNFCEDCVKTGDTWRELRLCLICGHVGCCDSSPNKHTTKHYQTTQHPLIRSAVPGVALGGGGGGRGAPGGRAGGRGRPRARARRD